MTGPLDGITVIDLTQIYNGPYCTFMMAQAGARVIKIEPPGGEALRRRYREGGGAHIPFVMLNSDKEFTVLDLKSPVGRAALLGLVPQADVLVENFRPGVMDRLGFARDVLRGINPRLIIASSSGYGSTGPYRDYPAMDVAMQAMSGVVACTGHPGQPPVKAGPAVCDFMTGTHLYAAVMTALVERERTGRVRAVEVAMMDSIYASLASNIGMLHNAPDDTPVRTGNRHGGLAVSPYNIYRCTDGWIAILANNDGHWARLARAFDAAAAITDPRFATMQQRAENIDATDDLVQGWVTPFAKEALFTHLVAAGVPCAPVREVREVMNDPHMHARRSLLEIEHPEHGKLTLPTSPLCFEGLERGIRRPSRPLANDQETVFGSD